MHSTAHRVFARKHKCSFFYWVIGQIAGRKFTTLGTAYGDSLRVGCLVCGHVGEVTGKEIAAG